MPGVALFALGPAVPVPAEARLPIQLPILVTAWVGMMVGVASVSDRPGLVDGPESGETRDPDTV